MAAMVETEAAVATLAEVETEVVVRRELPDLETTGGAETGVAHPGTGRARTEGTGATVEPARTDPAAHCYAIRGCLVF